MKIIKIEATVEDEAPPPPKKKWSWENITKVSGVIIGIAGLWYTALQYRASEKWKRAEFVVKEVKEFESDERVKLIEQALDYTDTKHYPFKKDTIDIDRGKMNKSLDTAGEVFTGTVDILRNSFDGYFDHLSIFDRYVKSDVMNFEEIKPYLEYYIDIIGDTANPRLSMQSRKLIWSYLNNYHFTDVQELFCLFDYNIVPGASSCSKRKFLGIL